MNRRLLILVTSVVATLLAAGGAFAQGDSILQRYDLAVENLEIAVDSVPADGAQARDELERALNALLTLSASASSPNLVAAMEKTFERTRIAIENQSRTDMAVQTAVLRGGFARLVMDSAYLAAAEGDLDLSRTRLTHLATSLGFTTEAQEELASAATTEQLRLAFEAGSAEAVTADLQVVERLLDSDRPAAYQNLARAYGESLLIQDSPRADSGLNAKLVAAAVALVDDDAAAVRESLTEAELQLGRLASRARGESTSDTPPTGDIDVTPSELPSLPGEETPAAEPEAAESSAVPAADAASDATVLTTDSPTAPPAGESTDDTVEILSEEQVGDAASTTAPLPLLDSAEFEAAVVRRLGELEAERQQAELDSLTRELAVTGLPAVQATASAAQLLDAGHASLDSALDALDASAGRAVAAQRSGDEVAARDALATLNREYQRLIAPLVASSQPDVADATAKLLDSVADRPNRTLGDVTLIAAQISVVRNALEGQAPTLAHQVELTVDSYWSNWTRVSVMIILGLLAIIPLVLLNLAFGGGNRNWRYIGSALFLLLVPVFYEALTSLAALLAAFVDWPLLAAISTWSMFSSVSGYVVWALLILIALLLATAGFYGICVQFGLLGGSRGGATTATGTTTAAKRPSGHTTIDWDEEF